MLLTRRPATLRRLAEERRLHDRCAEGGRGTGAHRIAVAAGIAKAQELRGVELTADERLAVHLASWSVVFHSPRSGTRS